MGNFQTIIGHAGISGSVQCTLHAANLCLPEYFTGALGSPSPDVITGCQGGAVALSTDQTAEREDERQRIILAGGHVHFRVDSWRVGKAGIQVSRCV